MAGRRTEAAIKLEISDLKDAPGASAKNNAAVEAAGIVRQLGQGKVSQLEPDEGQTIRRLRVALGHVEKGVDVKLRTPVISRAPGFLAVSVPFAIRASGACRAH